MIHYVVDASVVIQHFIPDTYTSNADALFGEVTKTLEIHIPEFCLLECTNVLWKQIRFNNLMVAEAKLRAAAPDAVGALALVNGLRIARKATPLASLVLVNPANLYAPNALLTERGRELYWEKVRRTDLIRFGMFLKIWQYKPTDDPKYLVFPVPSQSLSVNPNLVQNPGY